MTTKEISMTNSSKPAENFQELYEDVKKFIHLQTEYIKIDFVEKLTILLSALFVVSIVLVLLIAVLFYLCFSLAYALEPFFGSLAISFAVISGIYILLIALLVLFRKKLIINPLVRFLSNVFLNK